MDHLLYPQTADSDEDMAEFRMACLMSLVSVLASMPGVSRVTPFHEAGVLNAVAASIIQAGSTNTSQTPLRAAGLDGTGEVIQVRLSIG